MYALFSFETTFHYIKENVYKRYWIGISHLLRKSKISDWRIEE